MDRHFGFRKKLSVMEKVHDLLNGVKKLSAAAEAEATTKRVSTKRLLTCLYQTLSQAELFNFEVPISVLLPSNGEA